MDHQNSFFISFLAHRLYFVYNAIGRIHTNLSTSYQTIYFDALILTCVLLLPLLFPLNCFSASSTTEPIVNNQRITPAESANLDPVCRLILIEHPGLHMNLGNDNLKRKYFYQAQYDMANNANFLHHRCWAMVAKNRCLNSRDKNTRNLNCGTFHIDMTYVLQNAPRDWKYLPQIHTEVGQMYLFTRSPAKAILSANLALNLSREYIDAYILLVDAYRALDSKDQTKKFILEGLEVEPGNRGLLRRAKNIGLSIPEALTKPRIEKPVDPIKSEDESPIRVNNETAPNSPKASPEPALPTQTRTEIPVSTLNENATNKSTQPTTPDSTRKRNPYCRFCP